MIGTLSLTLVQEPILPDVQVFLDAGDDDCFLRVNEQPWVERMIQQALVKMLLCCIKYSSQCLIKPVLSLPLEVKKKH